MQDSAIPFAVGASVTRADVPELCATLAALLARRDGDVVCDVARVRRPDVATVEALARLRLTARRHGRELRISGAAPELRGLLGLLGLTEALPSADLGGRLQRQSEEREEPRGVEEVVDPGDPSV